MLEIRVGAEIQLKLDLLNRTGVGWRRINGLADSWMAVTHFGSADSCHLDLIRGKLLAALQPPPAGPDVCRGKENGVRGAPGGLQPACAKQPQES